MTTQPGSTQPPPADELSPWWSVNETLLRHPEAVSVFNVYGVDACCGGEASLAEAAEDAGVPLYVLLDALRAVIAYREGPEQS